MTRVSLKEAYDNKDVVAQIYAIRDIAEGAEDTANNAVSTANTASEHVDALVPQVEGAVQNANNASSSAQASAQTVAGYENRLSTVESETASLDSDLGAVTLRVTTAEGQIVTIEGRVTALETADGQNVKINSINDYAVGLTGNQNNISGIKKFTGANVKIQGGITFNDSNENQDTVRGSIFNTTPTLFIRSYSQLKNQEYAELRLGCNRTETKITFGLYLLSYQNVDGTATLQDYHPIYEKEVTL